ncbi:M48 family metallopeptidase [Halobaculum magnesiiphilum]|uniref:M48 family metalloprotease n=1 Tax=Halobaculum magnesiiphilum TaxID=1017351 RepID=A0A8T8WCW1_9EURY|nr:M48 family metalloprotease [Halobaculum magnesiiphilum]QZP37680.1 M48 family metalloprotease [Halobaculum magnesiiphilum]
MVVAGAATIAVYAVVAGALWLLVRFVWANRPDPLTLAAAFLVATLASGYLTYRFGTGRTLAGLDAREVPRERAPTVHRIVDALAGGMDVARPRVFVARLGEPNALALGGPTPALVIDYSLFRLLSATELEGVLAHELAHIEGRDGLVQTLGHSVVHTAVGLVALALVPVAAVAGGFARGVALVRGAPDRWHRTLPGRLHVGLKRTLTLLLIALTLLLRAYSRRREHAADDRAVEVTGRPLALASALRRIDSASRSPFPFAPLYRRGRDGEEQPLVRLLSTHPPMDERIERLRRRAEREGVLGRSPDRGVDGLRPIRPIRPDRAGDGWTRVPIEKR